MTFWTLGVSLRLPGDDREVFDIRVFLGAPGSFQLNPIGPGALFGSLAQEAERQTFNLEDAGVETSTIHFGPVAEWFSLPLLTE